MIILDELKKLSEAEYAEFEAKLSPTLPKERFIGVRVPKLREFAKKISKTEEAQDFLRTLPHSTYDENLLHSILLTQIKDYDECISLVEMFLPYVDNWAVCDTLTPKCFNKHKTEVKKRVAKWVKSKETYTIRFGIGILMDFYLDEDFKPEYLEIPASVKSEEYYVKMMIAWYYATALAKQWETTLPYITEKRLGAWEHNKTIQKAIESYRITDEHKALLKTYRV